MRMKATTMYPVDLQWTVSMNPLPASCMGPKSTSLLRWHYAKPGMSSEKSSYYTGLKYRGYAKVSIDSIVKRRYTTLLGHPPEEDNKTHLVGTGGGAFVVWRKHYKQFGNNDSSLDEEGNNGGCSSTLPRVSSPPPPMPSLPRRAPSPTTLPPVSSPQRRDHSPTPSLRREIHLLLRSFCHRQGGLLDPKKRSNPLIN
jgi:hypothetical protein